MSKFIEAVSFVKKLWELDHGLNPRDPSDTNSWSEDFGYWNGVDSGGDFDGDGIDNGTEFIYKTDPFDNDTDNDGLLDGEETGSLTVAMEIGHEETYTFFDYDWETGEEIEITETTWVFEWTDVQIASNPILADTNLDGVLDGDAVALGIDPSLGIDWSIDLDRDGLDLETELLWGTRDTAIDSDRDGWTDWEEIHVINPILEELGLPLADPTDPTDGKSDWDGDGIDNGEEFAIWGTDFLNSDSDFDGHDDFSELFYGSDPLNPFDPDVSENESADDPTGTKFSGRIGGKDSGMNGRGNSRSSSLTAELLLGTVPDGVDVSYDVDGINDVTFDFSIETADLDWLENISLLYDLPYMRVTGNGQNRDGNLFPIDHIVSELGELGTSAIGWIAMPEFARSPYHIHLHGGSDEQWNDDPETVTRHSANVVLLCNRPVVIRKYNGTEDVVESVINPEQAAFVQTDPKHAGYRLFDLLPVEIKVDADRDWETDILGDDGDFTTEEKPYQFWLNDDDDRYRDGKPEIGQWCTEGALLGEVDGGGTADNKDESIDCERDLEDFVRLHLDLGSMQSFIDDGAKVGLQFVDKKSGDPSIQIFHQRAGFTNYLFDSASATTQLQDEYGTAIGTVSSQPFWLPQDAVDRVDQSGILRLIFEGVAEGLATLALVLEIDSKKIEVPSVHMKLQPVNKMYEHWTAGDWTSAGPNPSLEGRNGQIRHIAAIPLIALKANDSGTYASDAPEEDDAIVCVHGFRVQLWERRRFFGDTSYKRLWHTGYKGRFFNFSWPAGYTPRLDVPDNPPFDPDNYADSEEIAYHVGKYPLKEFLTKLNAMYAGKVRMYAHSTGGVVASEALLNGAPVHSYAACQTSMGAHAYSAGSEIRSVDNNGDSLTWETPEVYAHYPSTDGRYYRPIVGKVFNFYNELDNALEGWEIGQTWKPNDGIELDNGLEGVLPPEAYFCDNFNNAANTGDFIYAPSRVPLVGIGDDDVPLSFPDDTYEIFAHCAEVRSFALGARSTTTVRSNFDLAEDFGDEAQLFTNTREDHTAQFQATMVLRSEFWKVLLEQAFGIQTSEEPSS